MNSTVDCPGFETLHAAPGEHDFAIWNDLAIGAFDGNAGGTRDAKQSATITKRDGVGFRLAYITDDFTEPHESEFDHTFKNRLFEYARAKARSGYPWRRAPPGLVE
jgi:hypothetical protein